MWLNLKNVLEGGRFSLPDSDSLMADLCSVGYRYDSAGRLLLESKDDLRKRGMPSPDEGDAVALCFTEPGAWFSIAPPILSRNRILIGWYRHSWLGRGLRHRAWIKQTSSANRPSVDAGAWPHTPLRAHWPIDPVKTHSTPPAIS